MKLFHPSLSQLSVLESYSLWIYSLDNREGFKNPPYQPCQISLLLDFKMKNNKNTFWSDSSSCSKLVHSIGLAKIELN